MAVTKDDVSKIISFVYTKDEIFKAVSLSSSYMARDAVDGNGVSRTDSFVLSEDEMDAFDSGLNTVALDIYDIVAKIAVGIDGAVLVGEAGVTIKVQDNGICSANDLRIIDSSIFECLKCGTLKEWFKICANAEFYGVCSGDYQAGLLRFRERLFVVRRRV